jgi:hypothetical protein
LPSPPADARPKTARPLGAGYGTATAT